MVTREILSERIKTPEQEHQEGAKVRTWPNCVSLCGNQNLWSIMGINMSGSMAGAL